MPFVKSDTPCMPELIDTVASGDMTVAGDLFIANRGLLYRLAKRYTGFDNAVSIDDLTQSAFMAVVNAARTFDSGAGMSWASWLALHAKKTMREAVGLRTSRIRAHNGAVSLDAPISDEGDATRLDLLEDDSLTPMDIQLMEDERAAAVRAAVRRLEGRERAVVKRHYFDGWPMAAVGDMEGLSLHDATAIKKKALRDLLRDRELMRYLDEQTDFYRGSGVRAFNDTWTSCVERAVLWRLERSGFASYG